MEGMVIPKRVRQTLSVAAATLLGAALLAAPVSAGRNTSKGILIGSSDGTGISDPGPDGTGHATLTFTPVTAGELSYFDVVVENAGGQNINNVSLSVGYDSDTRDESARPVSVDLTPSFPVEFPASSGVTIANFDHQQGDVCTLAAADVGPINCTVGTLRKNDSFTLHVLLLTTTEGPVPIKAVTKVSENTNDNGGNQDTFAAEGVLAVAGASCDSIAGWLPAGLAKQFGTASLDCAGQALDASVPDGGTTKDTVFSLATHAVGPNDYCAAGYTCYGDAFELSVNGGSSLSSGTFMTVSIVFHNVPSSYTTVNKLVIIHDGTVISTKKQDQCTSKRTNNCWTGTPTLIDGTFSIQIELTKNGFIRGG
jgi:hypothetical protein